LSPHCLFFFFFFLLLFVLLALQFFADLNAESSLFPNRSILASVGAGMLAGECVFGCIFPSLRSRPVFLNGELRPLMLSSRFPNPAAMAVLLFGFIYTLAIFFFFLLADLLVPRPRDLPLALLDVWAPGWLSLRYLRRVGPPPPHPPILLDQFSSRTRIAFTLGESLRCPLFWFNTFARFRYGSQRAVVTPAPVPLKTDV